MARHCRSCQCDISDRPPNHWLCVRCYSDNARKLATGHVVKSSEILTPERCDTLIKIMDDKSAEIIEAKAWLQSARDILSKQREGRQQ